MTNKEIAQKIEAAGHQVPAGLNRAKLEALAAEKGVPLEEAPPADDPGATPEIVGDGRGETLDVIGERGVKVLPALNRDGYQAVCEEFPELVGFGNTRLNAVEDLAAAIVAKLEADALADSGGMNSALPVPTSEDEGLSRLITPQMACAVFPGAGEAKEPEGKEE